MPLASDRTVLELPTTVTSRPALSQAPAVEKGQAPVQLPPALVDAADSVELKICLIDGQVGPAVAALGIDLRAARPQRIFYLDTPGLTLHKAGLIARVRRINDRSDDSVIKLRPATPHRLGADLRHLKGFKVEIDVTPGGFVCSASLKRRPHAGAIRRAEARRQRGDQDCGDAATVRSRVDPDQSAVTAEPWTACATGRLRTTSRQKTSAIRLA